MASTGDGFVDDSVKGPVGSKTKNKKLQGPFAYEKKIKAPRDDPELSQHVFKLPVDSEHKAKAINLFSFAKPHMRSFHLNWVAFFITFFSAYGAAPLIPTIREDIGLTAYKANTAGMLSSLMAGTKRRLFLLRWCSSARALHSRDTHAYCRCSHNSGNRHCSGPDGPGMRQVRAQIL